MKKRLFVIYNLRTLKLLQTRSTGNSHFTSEGRARAYFTRCVNDGTICDKDWTVSDVSAYLEADVKVVVKALLTGQDVEINKSQVGTCNDPSTERYYAM